MRGTVVCNNFQPSHCAPLCNLPTSSLDCNKWPILLAKGWFTLVTNHHGHCFYKISHWLRNKWLSNFFLHSIALHRSDHGWGCQNMNEKVKWNLVSLEMDDFWWSPGFCSKSSHIHCPSRKWRWPCQKKNQVRNFYLFIVESPPPFKKWLF